VPAGHTIWIGFAQFLVVMAAAAAFVQLPVPTLR
jgi:hypothetical protein